MTVTISCRVLWLSLLLLIPVPFYSLTSWLLLPTGRVFQLLLRGEFEMSSQSAVGIFLLLLQLTVWSVVFWGIAQFYGLCSKHWLEKMRGSIMGLIVFSLLIILSTIPVYHVSLDSTLSDSNSAVTFLKVYE